MDKQTKQPLYTIIEEWPGGDTRLCACGCGQLLINQQNSYIHGHSGRQNRHISKVELVCSHCGKNFQRYPSTIGRYCSQACSHASIHKTRVYHNIHRDYFQLIDNSDKAYILGLFIAEGYFGGGKNSGLRWAIALQDTDIALLEQVQTIIGGGRLSPKRINRTPPFQNRKPMFVLEICSTQMVRDLYSLGTRPQKDNQVLYPVIPSILDRHCLRGLFDGDGWIGKRQFQLTGTGNLLLGSRNIIYKHTGCTLTLFPHRKSWKLQGSRRDKAVLTWLYSDTTLYLKRKYEQWQRYWT